jgi:hypothetical protein
VVKRIIFPATRAVEHATSLPGVRPIRFFPVLWPLWQVQTTADIYDEQKFELIDHFLLRAIGESGLHDSARLAGFFGLPLGIVERCLRFLTMIEHVRPESDGFHLAHLGQESLRAGVRLVAKTSSQTLLFERHTSWPLPRRHYDDRVTVLDRSELPSDQVHDGTRFIPINSFEPFSLDMLTRLENDSNRAAYNLHSQLRNLQFVGKRESYLPCYLIETGDGRMLAYSACGHGRDEFLEQVFWATAAGRLIEAQGMREPADVWEKWRAGSSTYGVGELRQREGLWQVVMPSAAFGEQPRISLSRIGGYQFRDNYFIQVWCDDAQTREAALLHRGRGIARRTDIGSADELLRLLRDLAEALRIAPVDLVTLRGAAEQAGDDGCLHRLRMLRA